MARKIREKAKKEILKHYSEKEKAELTKSFKSKFNQELKKIRVKRESKIVT